MNNPKPTLLIFSQCHIYGGSERLMQSIYKNQFIASKYNVIFSYSYFKDYKKGIDRDCANQRIDAKFQPLYLLTNGDIFNKINLKFSNKLVRKGLKIPLFSLELIGLYAFWNYIYLYLYLLSVRPMVLHINNGGYPAAKACNQLAKVALFFVKIKVIYQVNNKTFPAKGVLSKILDFFMSMSVDVFLTHSKQNKEALINRGFDSSKVVSIPSYFNETIFNETFRSTSKNKEDFILCVVGFLCYRKGQMYLLKSLLLIKESNPELFSKLHLNLIGDGEDRFILKKFIEDNGLSKLVTLWGDRPDYINFIIECNLFLIPSVEGEDLPLVLLTAMQNKKCIVASGFAGITDLLTNGYDGILVKPNADTIAIDLSEAIIKLYLDSAMRDKMSENVWETFNVKLGEEKYANNLMNIYQKC